MPSFRAAAASCLSLLLAGTTGCRKEAPEYRLTAEQLAWQPYHTGDVLRFGQARSSKVRTFVIGEVDDRIITHSNGGGIPTILSLPTSSKLQQVRVDVRRTDTVRYERVFSSTSTKPDSIPITGASTLLEMGTDDNHGSGNAVVQSQLYWDFGFSNYLPIQEVVANQPLPDTTARVLPSLQVGGVTYGPVIQVSNSSYAGVPLPRTKPVRRLYYARDVGVVAFLEGGTLWYRLP
ncbi:hypothetical protein [Hymenobacter rubidus]|uniref:hypothetical protein n=1 Tax=Hymenobacter rubidus TaxID=1441626 RepID=UPI00191D4D98|nr:hypothetical protein [Hymenobacter rubidus]